MSEQLIKDAIDSMCLKCCQRLLHFQLFTITSACHQTKHYWIQEYLAEKKKREKDSDTPLGCGICFGLLEKFSQTAYVNELANDINSSGIQFKDFRISLTAPNNIALREKFIELTLNSIPSSELTLRLFNPKNQTVKELWKILTFHPLELIVGKLYNHTSLFDVKVRFQLDDSSIEADNKLLDTRSLPEAETKKRRISRKARLQKEEQEKGFTKPNVDHLLKETSLEKMREFYSLPFKRLICTTQVECTHDPIYLAGRYLKYTRTLPQTKWIIGGERILKSSVEELIGEVLKKELSAIDYVFTASGREDIDVKCLGKGRPFMIEFYEPKRTIFTRQELDHYQKLINENTSELSVKDLQYVTWEETSKIRVGHEGKTKDYSALCYCYSEITQADMDKLNSLEKIDIQQKTPIRVLHRRSVLTRPRTIQDIKAQLIDSHHFRINITTQAGTYVKEFVHGDLGRTMPSLCTILDKECDIIELDVEAVNLDFPPEIIAENGAG